MKKLELHRETLRLLLAYEARQIQGGMPGRDGQFSNDPFNPCYSIYTCARGGCKTKA